MPARRALVGWQHRLLPHLLHGQSAELSDLEHHEEGRRRYGRTDGEGGFQTDLGLATREGVQPGQEVSAARACAAGDGQAARSHGLFGGPRREVSRDLWDLMVNGKW